MLSGDSLSAKRAPIKKTFHRSLVAASGVALHAGEFAGLVWVASVERRSIVASTPAIVRPVTGACCWRGHWRRQDGRTLRR